MPAYFGYTNTIFGTQSTVNGAAHDYNSSPTSGSTWSYTGPDTYFVVNETTGATQFNGDVKNERVSRQEQIGGAGEQTTTIDGTERQIIWDYTFTVTDGTTTWRVAVIDVDLNNNDKLDGVGEDGYYLVFPDGMPPPDTNLTAGGIVEDGDLTPHASLGGTTVCFATGMCIDTPDGPRAIEDIGEGDLVLTREYGAMPVRWHGATTVPAVADLAPVVISAGVLGNTEDLVVSPQHGILVDNWQAELFFGHPDVLIRAVDLLHLDGVYRRGGGLVTYHHLLLDRHATLCSNGLWSESLYLGDMTLQTIGGAARAELIAMFPNLEEYGPKVVPCARSFEADLLAG